LRRCLRSVGIDRFVFWLTVADPVLTLGVSTESLVYDCADPNFLPQQQSEFDAAESQVATSAALTTSSAHTLHAKMMGYNPKSFLLPNATSQDFLPQQTAPLARPPLLSGRSGPVVGYLGTIDWRFDAKFVSAAALALPDCTFAIVGRVNANMDVAMSTLRSLHNVVMPGQVGYDDGRAWVAAFTVGLIPFTMGTMNDAINPVKMYMYLMAGLPVVATAIRECRENAFVRTADTPEEFARLVGEATTRSPAADHRERTAFALRNTWEVRAEEAIALLRQNGLFP
jgi:glycosyltransferase involved in cell wall biosynthesis